MKKFFILIILCILFLSSVFCEEQVKETSIPEAKETTPESEKKIRPHEKADESLFIQMNEEQYNAIEVESKNLTVIL